MNVTIKLNSGLGSGLGPNFNLTANAGGSVTPNTATLTELLAGKSVSVSDVSSIIFVTSTGACTTQLVIHISGITSTTTTSTTAAPTSTTTSTTAAPTSTTTSTSTTTTLSPIPVNLAYSAIDGPTACYTYTAASPTITTYYLQPGTTLANGITLFTNSLYTTVVPDGFYSNGVDYWEVTSTLAAGELGNETPCPQTTTTTTSTSTTSTSTSTTSTTSTSTSSTSTSTTSTSTSTSTTTLAPVTMNWDLTPNNGGGAELQILNGSNSIIFSQTTSGVAQSGTFVTDIGQAPLTIKYLWTGGSGNIVRYRICDGSPGSEIYTSPDIDIAMGSDTYLLSPTPFEFWIHGSSGVNTHPVNCDGTPWVATTTTTSTTTAAPTCNKALVNVGSPDRAASDDGKVYFYFTDCFGDPYLLNYNTNKSHFDSGHCVDTSYSYGCYILIGGIQTACTSSSLELGADCGGATTASTSTSTSTTSTSTVPLPPGETSTTTTTTTTSTTTAGPGLTQVTINIGTQAYANGSGELTFFAYCDTGTTLVDTDVTVPIQWVGDLSSVINTNVVIYSGTNCGSTTSAGAEPGEYYSTMGINGDFTPMTSATQEYVGGGDATPISSCP